MRQFDTRETELPWLFIVVWCALVFSSFYMVVAFRSESIVGRQVDGLQGGGIGRPGGRDAATDDALAIIGLESIDPCRLFGQSLPDWQQEASNDVDRAILEFRQLCQFCVPCY